MLMSLKGKCIANVAPWEANLQLIGEIRLELQQQFDKFEEEKAKQKEMYDH